MYLGSALFYMNIGQSRENLSENVPLLLVTPPGEKNDDCGEIRHRCLIAFQSLHEVLWGEITILHRERFIPYEGKNSANFSGNQIVELNLVFGIR